MSLPPTDSLAALRQYYAQLVAAPCLLPAYDARALYRLRLCHYSTAAQVALSYSLWQDPAGRQLGMQLHALDLQALPPAEYCLRLCRLFAPAEALPLTTPY